MVKRQLRLLLYAAAMRHLEKFLLLSLLSLRIVFLLISLHSIPSSFLDTLSNTGLVRYNCSGLSISNYQACCIVGKYCMHHYF